jgi:membrane protease YdiL (CAAX protease family)
VLLFVTTLVLRRPMLRGLLLRQARGFIALLPRTVEERRTFAVLAVTAGICEEIIFRAFGIAYVRFIWASASDAWIIVLTSVAFGFAHLYQGLRGVVLTGIVGAVFASLVLTTGSLFAAMAIHAMIDLRVLGLPDLTADEGTSGLRRLPAE